MSIEIASLGRALLFLGIPFVLMVFYLQWKWARTCSRNIRVLVAEKSGGGAWELAPKDGGHVSIRNPQTNEVRTWPVNELATIDVLYPGVGFVPAWMQKTIRMAIVNEGDWEPLLNRSPHRERIASPDVVEFLRGIAEKNPKTADAINTFLGELSTGPTREMVADPAALGNLMRSGVLKALATVSDDLLDTLKHIQVQLARFAGLNGMIIYIGLGLNLVLTAFLLYQVMQGGLGAGMVEKVDAIYKALGITPGVTP